MGTVGEDVAWGEESWLSVENVLRNEDTAKMAGSEGTGYVAHY